MSARPFSCTGEGVDGTHCCFLAGTRCEFLVEHQGGRRFACGLRLELGSWAAVNTDPRYRPVGEHWVRGGHPFNYCEEFDPMACCRRDG